MAIPPPPDAKAARFREDVAALAGGAPIRLGLAVSGGPDSLALLLLARTAFPGQVYAATVDHGLRPESPGEARFVAGAERRGEPGGFWSMLVPQLWRELGRSRYDALVEQCGLFGGLLA